MASDTAEAGGETASAAAAAPAATTTSGNIANIPAGSRGNTFAQACADNALPEPMPTLLSIEKEPEGRPRPYWNAKSAGNTINSC